MKSAIVLITLAAAAAYAMTGIAALNRLEEKVESNTQRIENLECQLVSTKADECQ